MSSLIIDNDCLYHETCAVCNESKPCVKSIAVRNEIEVMEFICMTCLKKGL